jgi:hypothetical protein
MSQHSKPNEDQGTKDWKRDFLIQNAVPLSATLASSTSVLAGYPFDSLKTRMQVFEYASTLDCIQKTYKSEGLGGFYRGVLPVLASVSVFRSISFSLYHSAKDGLRPLLFPNEPDVWRSSGALLKTEQVQDTNYTHKSDLTIRSQSENQPIQEDQVKRWWTWTNFKHMFSSSIETQLDEESKTSPATPPKDTIKDVSNEQVPESSHQKRIPSFSSVFITSALSGAFAGSIIATISAPLEFIKVQKQLETLSLTVNPSGGNKKGGSTEKDPKQQEQVAKRSQRVVMPSSNTSSSWLTPPRPSPGDKNTTSTTHHRIVQEPKIKSVREWIALIYRERGLRGFYLGYTLHLSRDTLGTAVYFTVYESWRRFFLSTSSNSHASSMSEKDSEGNRGKPWMHMLSGGLAGSIVWIVMFPIDMTKSVYQKQVLVNRERGEEMVVKDWIKDKWRSKGWKGFYQGIGPQMIRSFPIHSINFLVYESLLSKFSSGDIGLF